MRSSTTSTSTEMSRGQVFRSSGRTWWRYGIPGALYLLLAVPALAQIASPHEEREQIAAFFKERFPGVALDDYVYGALIANPGGREQYDQIMEFPPFVGDIEQGRKIWEAPFRNGRTFSDCFANGGRNVVGNYPYYDEKLDRVLTFENALNACLRRNGEP